MNGYGLVTHCCRLSVAANMRIGRICGTSMHLRPKLPYESKSSARTSAEHYSKSGCRRKSAERPKLDEQLRLSAVDNKKPKSNSVQTRKNVEGGLRRRNVGETRMSALCFRRGHFCFLSAALDFSAANSKAST